MKIIQDRSEHAAAPRGTAIDLNASILGYESLPNKYLYRYQPPAPAMDLVAGFWKLEKEAEKWLEGVAQ